VQEAPRNWFCHRAALLSAGAQVTITSTTERIHQRARELDPTGKDVLAIVADLTAEEDSRRIVDVVFERYGRIDVLVNNAEWPRPVRHSKQDAAGKLVLRLAAADRNHSPHRILNDASSAAGDEAEKYGRIVNVSSVTGPLVSNRGSSAYVRRKRDG